MKMGSTKKNWKEWVTNTSTKIANRDTPGWVIPALFQGWLRTNLANCLEISTHVSVLLRESPPIPFPHPQILRIVPSPRRLSDYPDFRVKWLWCKSEFRRRLFCEYDSRWANSLTYLMEWILNDLKIEL